MPGRGQVKTGAKVLQIFTRFDLIFTRQERSAAGEGCCASYAPISSEFIDRKLRVKSLIVANLALLQINPELIVVDVLGALHQLRNFILA